MQRTLTLLAALVLLGSCRQSTRPADLVQAEDGSWVPRSFYAQSSKVDRGPTVSAHDRGDSLEFVMLLPGSVEPIRYGVGLNTDGNEDTGLAVRGGPDYLVGFTLDPLTLFQVTSRAPEFQAVAGVSWRQTGSVGRLAIAWADLPERGASLPWLVEVFDGPVLVARVDGVLGAVAAR